VSLAHAKSNKEARAADAKFYSQNIGKGITRSTAAVLVKYLNPIMTNKGNKPNLRGAQKAVQPPLRGNDTTRAAPVAIATRRTGAKPLVTNTAGGVTVAHRSFLLPVNNSLNFAAISVPCNPGLSGSFPWLAKLARRYEQYRFKKLRFEYRSVAASSTSGVVMMSFDYDAADSGPATKAEQAQTIPNSETNVWMNNDLSVRPGPEWLFVRAGVLATNLDVKTYDMGNMWLSSSYGNNVTGGELYVEYTVELRRPTDGPEVCGRYYADTTSFASAIGTANLVQTGEAFPFVRASGTTFNVLSGGSYMIAARASGTVLTAIVPLPTIISGGTSAAANTIFSCVDASGLQTLHVFKVRVDSGDSIVFANAGAGTTLTAVRYAVATIDYTPM
jgi:hypothetical protein